MQNIVYLKYPVMLVFLIISFLFIRKSCPNYLDVAIEPSKAVQKIVKSPFNKFNPLKYHASLCFPTIKNKNGPKRILQFCGGTFIKVYKVLTAAHCVHDGNQKKIKSHDLVVVHGSMDVFASSGNVYNVKEIIVHPKYDPTGLLQQYDVALLILAENATEINSSDCVGIAGSTPFEDTVGIFSGFGKFYDVSNIF